MLIPSARSRPLTVAMTAQIERNRMFDGYAACNHGSKKMLPAPPLIPHAMDKDKSFLFRITPLPVMKF